MKWEKTTVKIAVQAYVYGPLAITAPIVFDKDYGECQQTITHVETGRCFPRNYVIENDDDFDLLEKAVEEIVAVMDWSGSDLEQFKVRLENGLPKINEIQAKHGLKVVLQTFTSLPLLVN